MKRLAVLRPEPGAGATVARARSLGLDAFALPLFRVEPVPWSLPDTSDFDALLLTSANAARRAGPKLRKLRQLPAYAVGEATAAVARNAGLTVASSGSGGVDALLERLPTPLRLLHLCGEDRTLAGPTPHQLTTVPVYRSATIARPAGLEQLARCAVLVHSARAGQRLAELVPERGSVAIVAISQAAGAACGEGWRSVVAADRPSDEALLSLALSVCEQLPPE